MGDISDDIQSGLQCSTCGECFTQEHGYPVACKACWKEMTPAERKIHQRAIHPTFGEE